MCVCVCVHVQYAPDCVDVYIFESLSLSLSLSCSLSLTHSLAHSLTHFPIMLSLFQAHEAKEVDVVQNMYLPLAEKLMEKYFTENDIDAEAGTCTASRFFYYILFEFQLPVF